MFNSPPQRPRLHPTYKRYRNEFLRDYDELDDEEREIMLTFLRVWTVMEASRERHWEEYEPPIRLTEYLVLGAA